MEKIDVRKLEPAAREQMRRTVIRMLGRGYNQTAVAAELNQLLTVHGWAKVTPSGSGAEDGQRGRPEGSGAVADGCPGRTHQE
ncbi:MAG: hypothetical protein R3E34_10085 [Rhodocyclaceae bacterium]